jgi:hypothetical protein
MKRIAWISLILTLGLATVTAAAPQEPDMPPGHPSVAGHGGHGGHRGPGPHGPHGMGHHDMADSLFPPQMVLRHQMQLELSDEQVESIKTLLKEAHDQSMDAQVEIHRASEQLARILEPYQVDEEAALAAAQRAMALETKLKNTHLSLMIRVKNLLTEQQQDALWEMRRASGRD